MSDPERDPHPSAASARLATPRADHEIFEAFPDTNQAYGMDPTDGMPRPAIETTLDLAKAPPLDIDTLVCMADESEFVMRNSWGDITARFDRSLVERAPDGTWRIHREKVETALGKKEAEATMDRPLCDEWSLVQPIRPACSHYSRQMTDFEDSPEHDMVVRLCTARRTDSGEFLSLRDAKMTACELRDPHDAESTKKLDDFDGKLIAAARLARSKAEDKFDVDKALAAERK